MLTWSESFLDLVKEADAATVQAAIDAGADLEARTQDGDPVAVGTEEQLQSLRRFMSAP